MDPHKIGESRSDEDKERLKEKAEEVRDAIRNRFGEKGGFGSKSDESSFDRQAEGEQEVASTNVGADDEPEEKDAA
ncbi:MAG: hypothetical protein JWO13_625 [Acidobacteriales bacterium]|nr:hypothetical protein [Terriglobales bacterium]